MAAAKHNRGRPEVAPIAVLEALNFIQERCVNKLSLTKVAEAVNRNANYLSENFKQVTGMNFVQYVAHTRFKNACELLRNPRLSISEIAFAAGFQSLSQFNRVFKRLSGKSPTQYRATAAASVKFPVDQSKKT